MIQQALLSTLNLNHLRLFALVAREGSIAAVARRLTVSQPTISVQLKALEASVGEPLLERRGRGLVLTELGRLVARHGEELLAVTDRIGATIAGHAEAMSPRFSVGVADTVPKLSAVRLLSPALAVDAATTLVLHVDGAERLLADLAAHVLDVVMLDHPAPPTLRVRAYNHLLLEADVAVFALPAEARRLRRHFPQSLDGAPFLLPSEGSAMRRTLEQVFRRLGVRPQVRAEVQDVGMLQALGADGHGAFAAPALVAREIRAQYAVERVGVLPDAHERFYAVTVDRRITHPAARAIAEGARRAARTRTGND
jgi:LysR family transcriptional regulator, transcriptional activator of nhaA